MGYDNRSDRAPRQMTDVKCSECGADTQVPFVPTSGKPVYCRDCYQKHRKY
ncbi:MAG: CxxC-x17-CxxC domain-containing protein [Candidatus Bathyarchaeia archaeon]|jgi:CxxC-x17-CxxC domain-containing protein